MYRRTVRRRFARNGLVSRLTPFYYPLATGEVCRGLSELANGVRGLTQWMAAGNSPLKPSLHAASVSKYCEQAMNSQSSRLWSL